MWQTLFNIFQLSKAQVKHILDIKIGYNHILTQYSPNLFTILGFLVRLRYYFPGRRIAHQRIAKQENAPSATKYEFKFENVLQKIKFPGLCVHACLLHASANARLWSPLSPVWKDLLKTLAAERTHADSHRRETIWVPHL